MEKNHKGTGTEKVQRSCSSREKDQRRNHQEVTFRKKILEEEEEKDRRITEGRVTSQCKGPEACLREGKETRVLELEQVEGRSWRRGWRGPGPLALVGLLEGSGSDAE